jgi:hypothetical protein
MGIPPVSVIFVSIPNFLGNYNDFSKSLWGADAGWNPVP